MSQNFFSFLSQIKQRGYVITTTQALSFSFFPPFSTTVVCVWSTVLLEFPNHLKEFPNLPTPMVRRARPTVQDCVHLFCTGSKAFLLPISKCGTLFTKHCLVIREGKIVHWLKIFYLRGEKTAYQMEGNLFVHIRWQCKSGEIFKILGEYYFMEMRKRRENFIARNFPFLLM